VLLSHGADPNKLGLDGTSPTFIAAQEGYATIVKSLALAGASIDLLDHEGTAPILMAAQVRDDDVVVVVVWVGGWGGGGGGAVESRACI
jgi:ankyrin repeat protein